MIVVHLRRSVAAGLLLLASPAVARADATTAACIEASEAGQTARDRGELHRARDAFAACAEEKCPRALRSECTKWLEDVDHDMPSVVVGVKDEQGQDTLDGRVLLDGAVVPALGTPVPIDPGVHVFRFERPGATPVERRLVVRTGERNRLVVEQVGPVTRATEHATPRAEAPPPTTSRRSLPTASWVLGGLGVVGLAGFGVLGAAGLNEKNHLRSTCSPSCTDADVYTLRAFYIGADLSLAVGVLALGAATWIALASGAPPKAASRLTPGGFVF